MRILLLGNFGVGWDGSICDEEHIAESLEWHGHTVTRWQRDDTTGYKENILEADITLISQWDGYPVDLWRYLPGKRVYWAFDHQAQGQEWHNNLIQTSDLYLSKRIADSIYPNWHWLPQDFAPMFLNRYEHKPERDIQVLFTGSYLPWATERIETLRAVDERFNLHIYSVTPDQWVAAGFKNVHGPVMDHALTSLIARAEINLSIDHTIEAGYWSDRNAQTMACGGFVLFRYVPFSELIFRDKVAYFYNIPDCLEKIGHYLNSSAELKMKASEGYSFAQDNLMVKHRTRDLLTILEGLDL